MYKEALTDIANRAFDSAPAEQISAQFHLPRMMINGIFNMLKIHIAKLTEQEAERILRVFFAAVDDLRAKLTGETDKPVSLVSD